MNFLIIDAKRRHKMKRTIYIAAIAALLAFPVYGYSYSGHHMQGKPYHYDVKTVETVSGEIIKVERMNMGCCSMHGIHLTIKTESGSIDAHLGPAAFIEKKMTLAKGDTVEIVGSRITFGDKPVIFAKTVKKGSSLLNLRSDDGTPLWRGSYHRNMK